ncbi:hemerythrin domain-containing protein [Halotalea alkalilenta]|uniref:Hemerythrin-like domain-containing protein n=1 Tax=Halotalea alkalilenta TaxID=376489 RepID=A0A172YHS8_9GAMM|nr:hemerythrin domain-containing protein [Halotalea alkalilenta]ANF58672.1 hypothetical protein A5892_15355 [Halotalea alkalilenta]
MQTTSQLRQDHANMARLLHVLSLKQRSLVEGQRPNFRLVREVIDYILDYMEEFMIPLETLCGDRMVEQDAQAAELVNRLARDYTELRQRLSLVSEDLDSILNDVVIPIDRFADRLRDYIEAHRAYLRIEREEFFPLIEQRLSEAEYHQLCDALLSDAEGRLSELKHEYPQLYREFREAPEAA